MVNETPDIKEALSALEESLKSEKGFNPNRRRFSKEQVAAVLVPKSNKPCNCRKQRKE